MSDETNLKLKSKRKKKVLIGAVILISISLIAALIIFIPKSAEAKRLAEQLDLGDKYLSELEYEQAVAAYLAVIEIDPKNVDAYLGLADAYVALGEYDEAIDILEDALEELGGDAEEAVREKLDEVRAAKTAAEVTSTSTPMPVPTATSTPTPEPIATSTPTPVPTNTLAPVPTATSTPIPVISDVVVSEIEYTKVPLEIAVVGNVVEFGSYEQDNDLSNGAEPIEWIVLEVKEEKALLFSLYGLDCQKYNEEWKEVTWETCSLRTWLNEEFYYNAFTALQRNRINETLLFNPDNLYFETVGGNDTLDNVFLLSIEEANQYFPADVTDENGLLGNKYRATGLTAYAIDQGAWYGDSNHWYNGNCWYWLRSPGDGQAYATGVSDRGYIYGFVGSDGYGVHGDFVAVRPALWINLDAESTDEEVQTPTNTSMMEPTTNTSAPSVKTPMEYIDYEIVDNECWILGVLDDSLTQIIIPQEIEGYPVVGIEYHAFEGCSSLLSIEIPENVTDIHYSAFVGCSNLESIMVDVKNKVYTSRDAEGKECNAIICENVLVAGCKNTVIPQNVTEIGIGAFVGCTGLSSITIPANIEYICVGAFEGCSGLESIKVDTENLYYTSRDFVENECNAIMSNDGVLLVGCANTIIPKGIVNIKGKAFSGCNNLRNIILPEGVRTIEGGAFEDCSNLVNIILPESVKKIGFGAFSGCTSLNDIIIPEKVTTIDQYTFNGCNSLTRITIPENVTEIGQMAFAGCSSLTSILIPQKVEYIGEGILYECDNLESIKVDNNNAIYSSVDSGGNECNVIMSKNVVIAGCQNSIIPNGTKEISDYALAFTEDHISVTIPESVTRIGFWAFGFPNSKITICTPTGSYAEGWAKENGCNVINP